MIVFYSFLCIPAKLTTIVVDILATIPFIRELYRATRKFFQKLTSSRGSYQKNTGLISLISRQCCISADNHLPPEISESNLTRHLREWDALETSAKSAFISDNEGNNSIVHVVVSVLRSSLAMCSSCPATSRTPLLATEMLHLDSYFNCNSSYMPAANSTRDDPRRSLHALLGETRDLLSSSQLPLQKELSGFDSCCPFLMSLNSNNSASSCDSATDHLVNYEIIQKRRELHKRMCRINKWHLLLLLHRMPWLQRLRHHALICLPSQAHLTWRLSTLHVSSLMLQAADVAMTTEIQKQQYSNYQRPNDNDAFSRLVRPFQTSCELQSKSLSYLLCERSYRQPFVPSYRQPFLQQETFGPRNCIDCTGVYDALKHVALEEKI